MENIPKSVQDPFYRYKRHQLKIHLTGGGNGKVTKIENLNKISKQLERTVDQLSKWFSSDLNTPIVQLEETHNHVLKGHFQQNILESSLEKFIKEFVLCSKCNYPETMIKVMGKQKEKEKKVVLKCKCCGEINEVKNNKNKLYDYLLKDKRLIEIKEREEISISKEKEEKEERNKSKDITDYSELKTFILENKSLDNPKELNTLRDKLRLTPNELAGKISVYLLEDYLFAKVDAIWSNYFNHASRSKILLDVIAFEQIKETKERKRTEITKLLFNFYELDYLSEEHIKEWYENLSTDTNERLNLKLSIIPFIQWLENAEYED